MEEHLIAVEEFLKDWRDRPEVIGAVLTGSYASGTATAHSDVDVHILLADSVKWRERGNKRVHGHLIEYFANSAAAHRRYFLEDFRDGEHVDARMFAIGRVLFDKTGAVSRLVTAAKRQLKKKPGPVSKRWLELSKYGMWDQLENLRDLHHSDSPGFAWLYARHVGSVIRNYARFLRAETGAPDKLYLYFSDTAYRRGQRLPVFPDTRFSRLARLCLEVQDFAEAEKLTHYVLKKMGGFDIDGWKLRSPAPKEANHP